MSHRRDILVLGAGPSARALAAALAAGGARTACVAPAPGRRWEQNFGTWKEDIAGTEAEDCVAAAWPRAAVHTPRGGRQVLDRAYLRLDTAALQDRLVARGRAAGAADLAGEAAAVAHGPAGSTVTLTDGRRLDAALVVDATGGGSRLLRAAGRQAPGFQVAFGRMLRVEAHPWAPGEALLMDWRAGGAGDPQVDARPSFLYAMPLAPDRVFIEETVLVGRPAASLPLLARRLAQRVDALGLRVWAVEGEERCVIRMGGPAPVVGQRTLGFGAAAGLVHPASGYQLARSLRLAAPLARGVLDGLGAGRPPGEVAAAAWQALWTGDRLRAWELYRFGMDALCTLDREGMGRFFDGFFGLPPAQWAGFLSASLPPAGVARAMAGLFARVDGATRRRLVALGTRSGGTLLRALVGA